MALTAKCLLIVLIGFVLVVIGEAQSSNRSCEPDQKLIRKEWYTMSSEDRQAFVSAVQCLSRKESKLNKIAYPGALNQFLDFVHIRAEKTTQVLRSGFALSWHRNFLWLFEQTLRQECSYSGTLPYWDFDQARTLTNGTIFDNSNASLSGNGIYLDVGGTELAPGFTLSSGSGGGCVTEGPFAYFNTTLLPVSSVYSISGQTLPLLALESNLNCLVRDLNDATFQTYCNSTAVAEAYTAKDMDTLYDVFNGIIGGRNLGLIDGIGYAIGGQMSSITSAAQDPLFYLTWAMLDRVYASWQASHPAQANDQSGTCTSQNMPPSSNVSLETVLPDWKYLETGDIKVADLMNTTGGVLCYEYDSLIYAGVVSNNA